MGVEAGTCRRCRLLDARPGFPWTAGTPGGGQNPGLLGEVFWGAPPRGSAAQPPRQGSLTAPTHGSAPGSPGAGRGRRHRPVAGRDEERFRWLPRLAANPVPAGKGRGGPATGEGEQRAGRSRAGARAEDGGGDTGRNFPLLSRWDLPLPKLGVCVCPFGGVLSPAPRRPPADTHGRGAGRPCYPATEKPRQRRPP